MFKASRTSSAVHYYISNIYILTFITIQKSVKINPVSSERQLFTWD